MLGIRVYIQNVNNLSWHLLLLNFPQKFILFHLLDRPLCMGRHLPPASTKASNLLGVYCINCLPIFMFCSISQSPARDFIDSI